MTFVWNRSNTCSLSPQQGQIMNIMELTVSAAELLPMKAFFMEAKFFRQRQAFAILVENADKQPLKPHRKGGFQNYANAFGSEPLPLAAGIDEVREFC